MEKFLKVSKICQGIFFFFLKKLQRSLEEFSKDSLNYLAAKFPKRNSFESPEEFSRGSPGEIAEGYPGGILDRILEESLVEPLEKSS